MRRVQFVTAPYQISAPEWCDASHLGGGDAHVIPRQSRPVPMADLCASEGSAVTAAMLQLAAGMEVCTPGHRGGHSYRVFAAMLREEGR